jgi:hypothetical protein
MLRVTRSELQAYQKPDLGRKYAVDDFASATLFLLSFVMKGSQSGIAGRWIHRLSSGYGCLSSWTLAYLLSVSLRFPPSMPPWYSDTRHVALILSLLLLRDIDISGLVAHIDLFAVDAPPSSETPGYSPPPSQSQSPTNNGDGHAIISSQQSPSRHGMQEGGSVPPNILSTCTNAVFGSSFVHGVQMDWRGEPVVFFVFSDLSVRFEGYFCMRYRCFDLFR